MNAKYHRIQYLIGMAAGATCLALSLLAYQTEGAFLRHGWIHEGTTGAFLLLFMAVLMLFLGSIHHSKMLFARLSPGAPEQQIEPVRAGRVVTWTVLLTLVVASVSELHSLCLEGGWGLPDIMPSGSEPPTLFGLPIAVGVGAVGLISIGPLGVGVISVGGFGVIAFQGIGIVSFGGVGLGVIAMGGAVCGVIAIGGAALGYVAIGGGAIGVYVLAGGGKGRYVLTRQRQDPEAVAFFSKWFPRMRTAFTAEQAAAADDGRETGFSE
jgi:MFS family permease